MSSKQQAVRVGVDIGGTFTDVALEVGSELHSTKVLTDYTAPERAILTGLKQVLEKASLQFSDIEVIIHGTTLATNSLIMRDGARTALITTEGFRDVIEMRTENRFEQYDLNIQLPPALVDRHDRYVLKERIDVNGNVLVEPAAEDIESLINKIEKGGYESVAIGFLHSYANGHHENIVRESLQKRLPGISISVSSEVSPQIREYERFNTVCANAYVKPLIKSYLDRLSDALKESGAPCPIFMMHSGGGIISVDIAAEFPVRLVESGPAGGAIFAAHIAERYGLNSVVSFDMGGTTAKICLIEDYVPKTAKTFEVARTYRYKKGSGMPISIPVVEMVEIGAGGGSIASVDGMRQIRVGPRSAGSEPGPACYQRGGEHPTVTDANVLLGRLDPDNFAGGDMRLSSSLAQVAVEDKVASPLGLSVDDAAYGIIEVVDESMSNAGRVHAVESGHDISNFAMITFGGGGPVHAGRLCEKMGIDRYLVPPGAGVGSAIGFLRAPFGFESIRSGYMRLSQFDASAVNELISDMSDEAVCFAKQGLDKSNPTIERTAYMRYAGQGWEIPVAIPERTFTQSDTKYLRQLFETAYVRFFGRAIDRLDVEIVSWSIKAVTARQKATPFVPVALTRPIKPQSTRKIFEARDHVFVEAGVYDRDTLEPGDIITGPAVVVERETATILPAAFDATVQTDRCLFVQARLSTSNKEL